MNSPAGDRSARGRCGDLRAVFCIFGGFQMNRNELLAIGQDSVVSPFRCASRSNWTRRCLASLAFVLLMLGCLPSARAQVSASIKGIVTDPSGAPVPAATVTTKNTETAAARSAITDDAGRYQIVWLAVGQYEVAVTKPGFQEAIRSGI